MSSFITKLKIKILSWLLFHANKGSNSSYFYTIKSMLLDRYGVKLGTELQEIASKTCYSCNGSGTYHNDYKSPEFCWHCAGTGVFKDGFWCLLEKWYFGNYYFHRPDKKLDEKPVDMRVSINGYISKTESEYTLISRLLLGIYFGLSRKELFDGNYVNVYWACKWWWRCNWLRSWLYIFSYKRFPPLSDLIKNIYNRMRIYHFNYVYLKLYKHKGLTQ